MHEMQWLRQNHVHRPQDVDPNQTAVRPAVRSWILSTGVPARPMWSKHPGVRVAQALGLTSVPRRTAMHP
jgi:hypothetical protein